MVKHTDFLIIHISHVNCSPNLVSHCSKHDQIMLDYLLLLINNLTNQEMKKKNPAKIEILRILTPF